MASEEEQRGEGQVQPAQEAAEAVRRSVQAWNELLAASTDMAFDLVLKNWNYSRSLRGAADQAILDALKMQQRLSREMLQAWQGQGGEAKEKDGK